MIRPTVLSAALWAVLSPAYAETPTLAEPHDFDRVQVTATRTERAASDVAATVDVIDREQLDRQLVQDIRDLVRYEPGVSVTRSAARFGQRVEGSGHAASLLPSPSPAATGG